MSSMREGPRRRADAVRSRAAIVDACLRLLDRGEDPTVGRIAGEAGVTRQTVYAHFDSREDLLRSVVAVLTEEVAAELATTGPSDGDLPDALDRWCATVWRTLERRPALLNPVLAAVPTEHSDVLAAHERVVGELRTLVRRARRERPLPRELGADWLVRAVLAHGHAVGQAVTDGSLGRRAGAVAFRHGVRGLLLGAG